MRVVSNTLPDPPYPANILAKGWRFELDYERINRSSTWALASAEIRPWCLMIWYQAWQEAPMGTLPDDDAVIAAKIGMPLTMFQTHRAVLLRGWELHSDGLLYHETITQRVLVVISMRAGDKKRQAEYRINHPKPRVTRDTGVTPAESRTRPTPEPEPEPEPIKVLPSAIAEGKSAAAAPDGCPDCPHQKIVDAWHEALPAMPRIATWTGQRETHLRVRWRERFAAGKYKTEEEGVAYWRRVFVHIGKSAFLTGANERGWTATLPWFVRAANFAKFLDGDYHKDRK